LTGEEQSRPQYYPGETTQATQGDQVAQSRSGRGYFGPTREPGLTKSDVVEIVSEAVGEAMRKLIESISPETKPVEPPTPQNVQLPKENVQLAGEKVNYRIALNPEIFFRYSVFKARATSLGNKWEGTPLSAAMSTSL
jgi:hypothetical protein